MQPSDDPLVWLARAASSLALAEAARPGVLFEDLCFQAQQCAEKALKALLISRGAPYPFVHDIGLLLQLAAEKGDEPPAEVVSSVWLTRFAVLTRYPNADPPVTASEYSEALEASRTVFRWARVCIAGSKPG